MKILVTGAAGFIGSNLSEYLLNQGHTVVAIDNFNDYYNPQIKEYNIRDFQNHPDFTLYRLDLLDVENLSKVFKEHTKFDAIIHLAAWAGVTPSIDIPNTYVKNNIEATINLAELCKAGYCNNFLFASTSSVYGDNATPFTEEMSTDFPLAPYPATKKACEVMLYSYSKNFDINVSIFRIFNPNGKRLRPDLALPKLVKSCLYGTEFPLYWSQEMATKTGRDYCYVEHIFEAFMSAVNNPNKYEIFNLGNSNPVTLSELISTVEGVVGKEANIVKMPPRKGEMFVTYANIDKAKKVLGYNPSTSLKQIVEIYYNWFQNQEDWYKKLQSV
jgi:UDP-glucuronate 4-epimerase